jgi:hypothetical protein
VFPEALGILVDSEAEHQVLTIVAAEGMAARAERQALAELAQDNVVGASAAIGRHRDLMRPSAVGCRRAQLAFSSNHGSLGLARRP